MKYEFEEEIVGIELGNFNPLSLGESYYDDTPYMGIIIYTEKRSIYFGISDFQSCCEQYDFTVSGDYKSMVNQKLTRIKVEEVDDNLVTMTVKTDKETFEFNASNYHNGYYSHGVVYETRILEQGETWRL